MKLALILAAPWVASLLFVRFRTRFPSPLPVGGPGGDDDAPWPRVSVVVPARNEAHNIAACLESLVASRYPNFEIVVVDDRSEDDTYTLAAAVQPGAAARIEIVRGAELPPGWLGKPWACQQGADVARGDVLLFTDADTVHGPTLLGRAVRAMREERADLLTLIGRQVMGTFWERLVQPHVFLGMLFRFPDFERVAANDRWRDAIANGQFILMPGEAYRRIGGHAAVRDEVVEDLALAQHVKRAGLRLRVRSAEDDLGTRMYRSLSELVAGWSKNLVLGGQQSFPPWMRPLVPPVALLSSVLLWLLPPVVLLSAGGLAWAGRTSAWLPGTALWAGVAVGASVLQYAWFSRRMGASPAYGLIYPLGAAVAGFIFLRSWTRGTRVRWKGRDYRVPAASSRP